MLHALQRTDIMEVHQIKSPRPSDLHETYEQDQWAVIDSPSMMTRINAMAVGMDGECSCATTHEECKHK